MIPETRERTAAHAVLECVRAMGARRSNAVLELLAGHEPVQRRRYPEGGLRLGGAWRAYYHCHPAPRRPPAEHGHFHVFAALPGGQAWTHVAGLSMDRLGQPLRWFAVNRWVTGGVWVAAPALAAMVARLPVPDAGLVERWLAALLVMHRRALAGLLRARDRRLTEVNVGLAGGDIFESREVYELAERPIDLTTSLERVLSGARPAGP
ncbi:MAG: hypothetical protein GWO02_16345 [Gammaproteobacteria bacterium]|nr:hypothetical protein [Gammaproteobacteria bacterium]